MSSATTRLRELALIADDADALRDVLREHAERLGGALGVSADQLEELARRDDISDRFRHLVVRARQREAVLREDGRRERALGAAAQLVSGARWLDAGVELEPHVLLGELLADAAKPWLGLMVDGGDVVLCRARLRRAALALRPFRDVCAFADSRALRLRWRGGRGGLNLTSQAQHVHDDSLVLRVVLERPVTQPVTRAQRRPPERQGWVGDVLAEVVG